MTNKEQLAYLAGLVDGEGCISMRRVFYKKKSENIHYSLDMNVANTNRWVLEWIKLLFGGNVYGKKQQGITRKKQWEWRIHNKKEIQKLLRALLPCLKIKKKQAQIAIKLKKQKDKDFQRSEAEFLYEEMRELNKRGI